MKKHVFFLILICLSVHTFSQGKKKKYFDDLDITLDRWYCRYQLVQPIGSFRSLANAKIGSGVEMGQYMNLTAHKFNSYNVGIDYSIGLVFNNIDVGDIKSSGSIDIGRGGNYRSYEFLIGPFVAMDFGPKNQLIFSLKAGPTLFFAPRSFSYNIVVDGNTYQVVDQIDDEDTWANDYGRTRVAATVSLLRGNISVALQYSYSKFRSARTIIVSPNLDGSGKYKLISGSASLRLMIGVAI